MTQQPPPGAPDGGYAQPQDPWAGGYEPGIASVPTDPIPQQYGQGYTAPGDWGAPTVAQGAGGPYGYGPQQQPRGRGGTVVLVILAVLVLGGAGGFGAYYYTNQRSNQAGNGSPTTPGTSVSPTATWDAHAVVLGDCLFNYGTDVKPKLDFSPCSKSGSFKVIRIVSGPSIPENAAGAFDRSTAEAECADTPWQSYYTYKDLVSDSRDLVFCMTNNP